MNMAINQHWVPQFYLHGFTTAINGGKVKVTDIKSAYRGNPKCRTENVRDVACMEHLYSLPLANSTFYPKQSSPVSPGWDSRIDHALQKIEKEAATLWTEIKAVPCKIDLSHGTDARAIICKFLASLHLRNPRMVGVSKVAHGHAGISPLSTQERRDAFHSEVASMPVNMEATLAGIDDRTHFLDAQNVYLTDITNVLHGLHWGLRYFDGGKTAGPLCTTDTPLFCVDQETMESTLIGSPNSMVICALTSRLLLIATAQKTTTPDGMILTCNCNVDETAKLITLMNQFIVHYGTSEAYSGTCLASDFPYLRD